MTCDDTTLSLGVYLIGALDAEERATVEAHLRDCEACRHELDELAALPSLLERLSLDDFAIEPPVVPEDLFDRVALRAREQDAEREDARRHRYRRLTAVAAAVVLIAGATVGSVALADRHGNGSTRSAFADRQGAVSMRVTLAAQTSGTSLQVNVAGLPEDEHCQLIAIAKDGTRDVAGNWSATYHGVARETGSTRIARSQLAQLVLLGTDGHQLVTVPV